MIRRSVLLTAVVSGLAASIFLTQSAPRAAAHCEVPCGIYDDSARVHLMLEDATTVAKATGQIIALSEDPSPQNLNQITRWVTTKDDHATRIQHTISQYFLTQRVKAAAPGSDKWDAYVQKLVDHHAVLVAAMKTKQNVDTERAAALTTAIEKLHGYY